jgi:tetratricopeptide (TPR) repeat protein
MSHYGVRDVEKLLRLPRSTVRSLVQAGFVAPDRGPRGAWRFSFQDLIVMRTAQELWVAKVSRRRIARSMRELRRHLPEAMPLSGLRISAVADRVVVKEGASHWQVDSGQYLLAFEGDPASGSLSVVGRSKAEPALTDASQWLERAAALESDDVNAALVAYEHAIALMPNFLDAHINRGCLLHEAGRLADAEAAYRSALELCDDAPAISYNLALVLEDLGRKDQALASYKQALEGDPRLADCHYNLALLYEDLGKSREAIRHMAHYRKLVKGKP